MATPLSADQLLDEARKLVRISETLVTIMRMLPLETRVKLIEKFRRSGSLERNNETWLLEFQFNFHSINNGWLLRTPREWSLAVEAYLDQQQLHDRCIENLGKRE